MIALPLTGNDCCGSVLRSPNLKLKTHKMTKQEILTQMFEKGQPFYNEIDILDAMDTYLIQELKKLLEECKTVHSEYIVEKIESQIDYLEHGI